MDAVPIVVNGEPRRVPPATTVAVEHNGEILPRHAYAATSLAPNDRLEIVGFVQGG